MNVEILKHMTVTSTLNVSTLKDRTPAAVTRDILETAKRAQVILTLLQPS